MLSRKSVFIAFEGIDGAGKSSLAKGLVAFLLEMGRKPVLTFEPTMGPYGTRIRQFANTKRPSPQEEYDLFLQDRCEHVRDFIAPMLATGHDVLCDRYFLSSVAYQGARGLNYLSLFSENVAGFPVPDAALYIDISPELSHERTRRRGNTDRYDDSTDFAKVREIYCALNAPWIHTIDGALPREKVLSSSVMVIKHLLC